MAVKRKFQPFSTMVYRIFKFTILKNWREIQILISKFLDSRTIFNFALFIKNWNLECDPKKCQNTTLSRLRESFFTASHMYVCTFLNQIHRFFAASAPTNTREFNQFIDAPNLLDGLKFSHPSKAKCSLADSIRRFRNNILMMETNLTSRESNWKTVLCFRGIALNGLKRIISYKRALFWGTRNEIPKL